MQPLTDLEDDMPTKPKPHGMALLFMAPGGCYRARELPWMSNPVPLSMTPPPVSIDNNPGLYEIIINCT